ncbi:hypothetical protein Hanom_Chr16g01455951 [Helianthus anomalus]
MYLYNCMGAERVFILDHLCVVFGCFPLRLFTCSCFPFFVFHTITASFLARTARPLSPKVLLFNKSPVISESLLLLHYVFGHR